MPYIKTPSGINWHYITKGKGAALLFIHGWAGDFSIWFKQIDYFSKNFKVIVLDLPGHGKSSWEGIDFNSLVDDIIFICRRLKLKKIIVLGMSFGGQIAMKLAIKSKLVSKLVLVDTSPRFVKENDFKAGLSAQEVKKLSRQLETDFYSILSVFARSLFTLKERKKNFFSHMFGLFRRKKCFPKKDALQKMLRIIEKIDLRSALKSIRAPTLIICGDEDPICPLFVSEFMRDKIPHSTLRAIEGCGHMPFLTEPDKFNELVQVFLQK